MKNTFSRLGLAVFAVALPFAAHAQVTSALTAGVGVSLGADATGSDMTPILITHSTAQASLNASAIQSTSTTGNGMATNVSSEDMLRTHAAVLAANDNQVSSVTLSSEKVALAYREHARFLGLITMSVPVKVSVDATGSTTIAYPWYSFLLSTNRAALKMHAQAAVEHEFATLGASVSFSADAQTRLIDSLHEVLRNEASASASISASPQ